MTAKASQMALALTARPQPGYNHRGKVYMIGVVLQ